MSFDMLVKSRSDLKIVVVGGGTGSFMLLSSLKDYTTHITALVNMADDGGSTGVLRDELGVLPPGDVRQCLVALSRATELRDLFNYRFEKGNLQGHAFGNLFLTALEKVTGDFALGIELASKVLNIVGAVEPVTLTDVELVMDDGSGSETRGESNIGQKELQGNMKPDFRLEPQAEANPRGLQAIEEADIIVVAPGNLYGSLAPVLIVPGVAEALARCNALKIYVCNLVTKPGHTDGYSVDDFANEIERLATEPFLDIVLYNTKSPDPDILERYAASGEIAVMYNAKESSKESRMFIGKDLLSEKIWENTNKSDPLAADRTLIRHDSKVVADVIIGLYDKFIRSRS